MEDFKSTTLSDLTGIKKILLEKRERLLVPVKEVDKEIEHVTATIDLILKTKVVARKIPVVLPTPFPIEKINGMTHIAAIVEIARFYDGMVRTQDAKAYLIEGGVMKDTKNSINMVHNAIIRSGRFERIAPGKFRLKPPKPLNAIEAHYVKQVN